MAKPTTKTTRGTWIAAGVAFVAMLVLVPILIAWNTPTAPQAPAPSLGVPVALQEAWALWAVPIVATAALIALVALLARLSGKQYADRYGTRLEQAERRQEEQIALLIDERNAAEQKARELEIAAKADSKMIYKLRSDLESALTDVENLITERDELKDAVQMDSEAFDELLGENTRMLKELDTLRGETESVPLDVRQAIALMAYARQTQTLTVRESIRLIRGEGISVPNVAYQELSKAVRAMNAPLPHSLPSPVRERATETKAANGRRERTRTRSRTQARTRKARK